MITCARAQACTGSRYPFLTHKERDIETDLDYSVNRYYSNQQGRFSSVDPENAGASLIRPQSWNGYSYSLNNPLRYIDPDGLRWAQIQVDGGIQYLWFDDIERDDNGQTEYDRALASGYSAVDFDESKLFEYRCECGAGGDRYGKYRLNPDGSHGYADVLDGNYHAMSTDWNAQFAIGGLLNGLRSLVSGLFTRLFSTQAATQATQQVTAHGVERLAERGLSQADIILTKSG